MNIVSLKSNQVFVFGSNLPGFHGAGAAGYAMLNVHGNQWRTVCVPGTGLTLDRVPNGTRGCWAVKGVGKGFQQGLHGCSYAIPTVTHPGARKSIPLEAICKSLVELYRFAAKHSDLEFIVAQIGTHLAGYTPAEIGDAFAKARYIAGYSGNQFTFAR